MGKSGKALCVLRRFENPLSDRQCSGSHFLFDPLVARGDWNGVEEAVLSTSCSDNEEELFCAGNEVIWRAGKKIRKRFTAISSVLKACWCSMDSIREPVLCVLHSNLLSAFTPSGDENLVPLPFAVACMWSLPCGLILQREPGPGSFVAPTNSPPLKLHRSAGKIHRRASVSPAAINSASVYYTLLHHLEEPEALEIEDSGVFRSMTDWDERIIWTSNDVPYVACYHRARKQHSLWEIKSRKPQDKERLCSIYLKQRWQEKGGQPQATQVFTATDEDGEPLLCFLIKESKKLFCLRLPSACGETIDIAWTISAISAAPTIASRPRLPGSGFRHYDLLVLAPDSTIFLYTGRYPLCTLYLPSAAIQELNLRDGISQGSNGLMQVVQLMDPVENRVNVVTSTGQVYRCAVDLSPTSEITRKCLSALAEGLRPSFYRFIFSSFLECESSKTGNAGDAEWSAFSKVITEGLGEQKADESQHKALPPWEFLVQSSTHKHITASHCYPSLHMTRSGDGLKSLNLQSKSGYASMLVEVLETLHMVYEDHKLDTVRWRDLWKLAVLLSEVAITVEEYDYAEHYLRDFPTVAQAWIQSPKLRLRNAPPNHYAWIEASLTRKTRQNLHSLLRNEGNRSVNWSRKVLGFFEVLLGSDIEGRRLPSGINIKIAKGTSNNMEQRTVLAMVAEEFGLSDLDRLPSGISHPLRHALNSCRESPPGDWPSQAYILVGREDLAYTAAGRTSSSKALLRTENVMMAAPYMLHLRATVTIPGAQELFTAGAGNQLDGKPSDGMDHMFTPSPNLRFGCDLRLNEVRRLLCSSKPVAVKTASTPDVSDPDLVAQQQAQLWQLAQRTTALSFGRGAFALSTLRPLLTEALPIPKLVLSGKLPSQHDATINLDVNTGNITELTSWPEFHNGVAAGLRLAPGQAKITRTWIVYNKPEEPSFEHAGFVMSLGLHKHLAVLGATDVFRYLSQEHDPTTVGVLLGMAAARRGTMDPAISKMLYLHIPARHPPSFPELELSSLLQSAALMAVGLLYQGSAHRLTTEILLAEIGRKPGSDSSLDREGYALAAGLALGLVTLGRGKEAWGLADLLIEDRLLHYMCGGSEPSDDHHRRFNGTSSYGGFPYLPKNYDDPSQTGGQVMEGSIVNLDVTAPGATLALGLMFMKTNDKAVAARLAIPDTHFALEYVRPDFILLRLVARSLILWDTVQATEEWIQSQMPNIVREAVASSDQSQANGKDLDMEALAQAHVNILAGACLSIGLRYAGTGSAEAHELLYYYALYFLKEKSNASATTTVKPAYVDRGTLETCLDIAVLALSVVMAGTGHLETFKLFRYLRRRNENDGSVVYGNHMAISMAIGFLFLGGGLQTFSTNDGAVAALLISMYPRFPTTPNDHRCHLQAFRHLYVLAAEPRCVQTLDVDTGLPVYVPLEMTIKESNLHSETSYCRVSPCILPERSSLKRLRVCGPRYWLQDIQLSPTGPNSWWEHSETGNPFRNGVLYVKRKVGARAYADDPIGCRSLLSRSSHRLSHVDKESSDQSKVDELVGTFSSDPSLLAFAQLFCDRSDHQCSLDGEFDEFCLSALFECVSTDRPALLQTYFDLYSCVEALVNMATSRGSSTSTLFHISLSLQSFKVSLAYCEAAGHTPEAALKGTSLIQRTFLASLSKRVDELLAQSSTPRTELATYMKSHVWPPQTHKEGEEDRRLMLAVFLCWNSVPLPSLLDAALQKLQQVFRKPCKEDANTLLPILATLLPGAPARTLQQLSKCIAKPNTNV